MIEIRRLLVLILFIICCGLLNEAAADNNKGFKCEGTTYSSTGRVNNSSAPIVGCYQAKAYHDKQIELVGDYRMKTIVYQGCEYVVIESYYQKRVAITHKSNCLFCKKCRQKEMKELVEQLKKK